MTSFGEPISGADFAFDCIGREVTMESDPARRASRHPGRRDRRHGGVLVGVPHESGVTEFTQQVDDARHVDQREEVHRLDRR